MSLLEEIFKRLDEDKENGKIVDYAVTIDSDKDIHIDLQPTKVIDKVDLNFIVTNKGKDIKELIYNPDGSTTYIDSNEPMNIDDDMQLDMEKLLNELKKEKK